MSDYELAKLRLAEDDGRCVVVRLDEFSHILGRFVWSIDNPQLVSISDATLRRLVAEGVLLPHRGFNSDDRTYVYGQPWRDHRAA